MGLTYKSLNKTKTLISVRYTNSQPRVKIIQISYTLVDTDPGHTTTQSKENKIRSFSIATGTSFLVCTSIRPLKESQMAFGLLRNQKQPIENILWYLRNILGLPKTESCIIFQGYLHVRSHNWKALRNIYIYIKQSINKKKSQKAWNESHQNVSWWQNDRWYNLL